MRAVKTGTYLLAALLAERYIRSGPLTAEDYAASVTLAAQLFPLVYLPFKAVRHLYRKPKNRAQVLFNWPTGDPFTVADMCRSFLILGAIGSGKTSSSGKMLARALLSSGAGIIIFASKPEDLADWRALAAEAGRSADFKVFGVGTDLKCNILAEDVAAGMDTPGVVDNLMDISQLLVRSKKGGEGAQFWEMSQTSLLTFCIEPLRLVTGTIRVADIRRMIASAPRSPSCIRVAEGKEPPPEFVAYRQGFHYEVMAKAHAKKKTHIEDHDFKQCSLFWNTTYCTEDPKTRSNIEAGTLTLLDVFLRGIVHEKLATVTNIRAADLENGAIWFVDFSPSKFGASGKFICAALKRHVQAHCLRRVYKPGERIICLWSDECQRIVNERDSLFIDEARSHGSALVYLSQSISNFRMALDADNAEALLGQFGHVCVHACDQTTAEYMSKRVGSAMQMTANTSPKEGQGIFEQVTGGGWSVSFQQGVRPLAEAREFMTNLRNGGDINKLIVDGWVVRTGMPFSGGLGNAIKVEFSQK